MINQFEKQLRSTSASPTIVFKDGRTRIYKFSGHDRLVPNVLESRFPERNVMVVESLDYTYLAISDIELYKDAISEEVKRLTLLEDQFKTVSNKMNRTNSSNSRLVDSVAPRLANRKEKKKLTAESMGNGSGIAAENDPNVMKDNLLRSLENMQLNGSTLLDMLIRGGVKCKWQENQNAEGTMIRSPYLVFYKDTGNGDITNLLVIDAQELGDASGHEKVLKALISIAQNQGVGALDATISQIDNLKTSIRDATKPPEQAQPGPSPAKPTLEQRLAKVLNV